MKNQNIKKNKENVIRIEKSSPRRKTSAWLFLPFYFSCYFDVFSSEISFLIYFYYLFCTWRRWKLKEHFFLKIHLTIITCVPVSFSYCVEQVKNPNVFVYFHFTKDNKLFNKYSREKKIYQVYEIGRYSFTRFSIVLFRTTL